MIEEGEIIEFRPVGREVPDTPPRAYVEAGAAAH